MPFLFDKLIFGPVFSRRLGISLGINLLPEDSKICNFNCIYCECGWTDSVLTNKIELPTREQFYNQLDSKLQQMRNDNSALDVITFAGNGEPTLHPQFAEIIDDTIALRDKYFPKVKVAVLSNATMLASPKIVAALQKIDQNILKLDSAIESTINTINQPLTRYKLETIVENLKQFNGRLIIQTLFIRGIVKNKMVDNTTKEEIEMWLKLIQDIKPLQVMIYTIARETPLSDLEKISVAQLNEIALQVNKLGIGTQVSG